MKISRKIALVFLCLLSAGGLAANQKKVASAKQINNALSRQVSQFLNSWLVKQDTTRAQKYLSLSPIVCFSADENIRSQADMKRAFLAVLSKANEELGRRISVADAVAAFRPGNKKKYKEISHPARGAFSITTIPDDEIETYLCKPDLARLSQQGVDIRNLFLVTFTFRVPEDKKGGLLFVWAKEQDEWRILTFDALSF